MDALLPLGLQQLVFHVNRQSDLHRPDHAAVLSVQVFKYIEKILSHQRLVSFSLSGLKIYYLTLLKTESRHPG